MMPILARGTPPELWPVVIVAAGVMYGTLFAIRSGRLHLTVLRKALLCGAYAALLATGVGLYLALVEHSGLVPALALPATLGAIWFAVAWSLFSKAARDVAENASTGGN